MLGDMSEPSPMAIGECRIGQRLVASRRELMSRVIALENQGLQHALFLIIQDVPRLSLQGLSLQRYQRAFYADFDRRLPTLPFEDHDMGIALHGVLHLVIAAGQERVSHPDGVVKPDLPSIGDAELILAGAGPGRYAQPQYAHRHHQHYLHEAHNSSLLSLVTVALRTLQTNLSALGGADTYSRSRNKC